MEDRRWRMEVVCTRILGFLWSSSCWYLGHVEWHMQTHESSQMPGSKLREPKHTLLLLDVLGELLGGAFWLQNKRGCYRFRHMCKMGERGGERGGVAICSRCLA